MLSDLGNQESTPKLIDIAQKGFAKASNYEKARLDYPLEAVKFLLKQLRLLDKTAVQSNVLALRSETGKLTRVMLEVLKDQNVRIIASDPVDQMCVHFKRLQSDVDIIQCAAGDIRKLGLGLEVGGWGLGFGVWGLGFRGWGLGFGNWGLGFGVWSLGVGVGVGVRVKP